MADHSLNTNSTFPSNYNVLKYEVEEKSTILRSRPPVKDIPNIEEVDSKYKQLIFLLEKQEEWSIRNYKGFWQPERIIPGMMAMEEANFQSCPGDVIVASFIKSGTTWLKALTFTIMHRNKYDFSSHPLLKLNPHDCVPYIEYHYATHDEQYLETLPYPRILGTHLPYSILPVSIKATKCPIIFISREPKDVLVSLWHMVTRFEGFDKTFPFTRAFDLFCEGQMPCGPIWDHNLEYYMKSLDPCEKILFLKYEELMKDPVNGVMNIANFIGCPFSEEEMKNGLVEEIVEFCSFNKLKDLDINKNGGIGNTQNDYLFRKAVVGDWQNHMTPEMAMKLDEITKWKLHNSGFTY